MATTAQIVANRRPSPKDQRSTGPRTPAGKARSSQNALKHGLRAQAILDVQFAILGENPADFAELLQSLAADLKPVGPLEEICLESIALGLWRHRRLLLSEMGYIAERQYCFGQDSLVDQARTSLPSPDFLDHLTRYEAHLNRQLQWHMARLAQLQRERRLEAKAETDRESKRRRDDAEFVSVLSQANSIIATSRALARRTGDLPSVHSVPSAPAPAPTLPNKAKGSHLHQSGAVLPTKPNLPLAPHPTVVPPNEPNASDLPAPAPRPTASQSAKADFVRVGAVSTAGPYVRDLPKEPNPRSASQPMPLLPSKPSSPLAPPPSAVPSVPSVLSVQSPPNHQPAPTLPKESVINAASPQVMKMHAMVDRELFSKQPKTQPAPGASYLQGGWVTEASRRPMSLFTRPFPMP